MLSEAKHLNRNHLIFWVLLLLLGAAGVFLLFYITPFGMGLVNDSVGYIGGARNILAGAGYSRLTGNYKPTPITNFPPMYSIVLAGFGLFGLDALPSSWFLNLFLFGANIVLMGVVIRKASGSTLFSLLGALIFGISLPVVRTHSFAMSEPLYLFLAFLVLLTLLEYFQTQKWVWLATCGLLAGAAFVTRFVAVSLFATVLLCLLVFLPDWKKRLVNCAVFLAAALPLAVAWMARNMLVTSNPVNRLVLFHPIELDKVKDGLINFWGWIFPQDFILLRRPTLLGLPAFILLLVAILAGVVLALIYYRRGRFQIERQHFILGWGLALTSLLYLGVVLFTMTFVDASVTFEQRTLAPFDIYLAAGGMILLAWLWSKRSAFLRAGILLVCLLCLLSQVQNGKQWVMDLHHAGQGFASEEWSGREIFSTLRQLPKITIYSNKSTALYILANRPAYILPTPLNPATGLPNTDYATLVGNVRASVLKGQAMVVVLDYDTLLTNPDDKQIMTQITGGLPVYKDFEKDIIFGKTP